MDPTRPALLALSIAALGSSILVAYVGPLYVHVDTRKGQYRQADDPEVVSAWQALWWSVFGAWALWLQACAMHGAAYLVPSTYIPSLAFNVVTAAAHVTAIVFAYGTTRATMYGHGHTKDGWMKTFPLIKHAFCTSVHDTRYDGKLLINFWVNYDDGFVLSPGPAQRTIVRSHVPFEVAHTVDKSWWSHGQAWFYAMPGTGVWVKFNNIITFGSHEDFATHFGYSCGTYMCPQGIRQAFVAAAERGHDAIQFAHHSDHACGSIASEIVAIGETIMGNISCPVQFYSSPGVECQCSENFTFANCGYHINNGTRPMVGADTQPQILCLVASVLAVTAISVTFVCRAYISYRVRARHVLLRVQSEPEE